MKPKSELSSLKNIGPTIERRLNEIGVFTRADLESKGAARAFQEIWKHNKSKSIPVCYYLYSLQGALLDRHWDDIPQSMKDNLLKQAKPET